MAQRRRDAPSLIGYEIASALTRAVTAGRLASEQVTVAWQQISAVPLTGHPLSDGPAVVAMAGRLQRRSAYDAAYLVLADQLTAGPWTLVTARWRATPNHAAWPYN